MSLRSVEPRDPLTGETSFEALQREIEEHRHVVQVLRENEERIRKVKEMERWAHGIIYKFTMFCFQNITIYSCRYVMLKTDKG